MPGIFDTVTSRMPIRLQPQTIDDPSDDRNERHHDAVQARRNMLFAVLAVALLVVIAAVAGSGPITILLVLALVPMLIILGVLHLVVRATR